MKCRNLLKGHAGSTEEGTRNVVSECMGRLTLLEPEQLLPGLHALARSPSVSVGSVVAVAAAGAAGPAGPPQASPAALTKCTALNAIKFTIIDPVPQVPFLALLLPLPFPSLLFLYPHSSLILVLSHIPLLESMGRR